MAMHHNVNNGVYDIYLGHVLEIEMAEKLVNYFVGIRCADIENAVCDDAFDV
jgi:hypothetical protein